MTTGARNCGDYQECLGEDISQTSAPLCCTGVDSCESSLNITVKIPTDSSVPDNIAIRCDGAYSCQYPTGSVLSLVDYDGGSTLPGDIVAAGLEAFTQGSSPVIIGTSGDGSVRIENVFCTAKWGCEFQEIKNVDNLYCLASYGCDDASMKNVGNIFAYGVLAARAGIMETVDNVYCDGYQSCNNVEIKDVSGNVYGQGFAALRYAEISNLNGTLVAAGENAFYQANVTNVTNVCT